MKDTTDALWDAIEAGTLQSEATLLGRLIASTALNPEGRARDADLVRQIRADVRPGLMEVFLAEYGLSTEEGISLMCLAEALLRVPDASTMDALIEDKMAPRTGASPLANPPRRSSTPPPGRSC